MGFSVFKCSTTSLVSFLQLGAGWPAAVRDRAGKGTAKPGERLGRSTEMQPLRSRDYGAVVLGQEDVMKAAEGEGADAE